MSFKTLNLVFIVLAFIVILGLFIPNNVRTAIANNLWSIDFIKEAYAQDGGDPRTFSPPATHKHAGMLLAHQALNLDDIDRAWMAVSQLSQAPDALVLNTYAQVCYLREDYPCAIDAWNAAGDARSLHSAAVELRKIDYPDLASLAGRYAYEIYPEEYVHGYAYRLYQDGRTEEAISLLHQMLKDYPGSLRRLIWYRYLGNFHQKSENYTAAADVYRQALAEDVNNTNFWQSLGALNAQHLNNLQQAIFCYEKVLAITPQESQPYYDIADLYHQAGQLAQAESAIQKAVALAPDRINYHLRAAQIYEENGQYEKALDAYRASLAINPEHTEALQGIQRCTGSD